MWIVMASSGNGDPKVVGNVSFAALFFSWLLISHCSAKPFTKVVGMPKPAKALSIFDTRTYPTLSSIIFKNPHLVSGLGSDNNDTL
jgi:hypothetical protein